MVVVLQELVLAEVVMEDIILLLVYDLLTIFNYESTLS